MFGNYRRKRLRNRVILAALGVCIMTFGIWLNYRGDQENPAENAVQKVKVEETETENSIQKDDEKTSDENDREGDGEAGEGTQAQGYQIQAIDGVVKVFSYGGEHGKELYLITSIPFELLSEEDQKMLTDGIEIDTEEELGKFLENFDS